ncbi:MAG: OmpA family protein [Akkermansiaceae bacterium]|nr:OmpA family protein [Akkermansiaceae bacterium]
MSSSRSSLAFLGAAAGLAGIVAALYTYRGAFHTAEASATDPAPPPLAAPVPEKIEANSKPSKADEPQDPEAALANAGIGAMTTDPADLLAKIGNALEAGDLAAAGKLIGSDALTPEARKRLAALASHGGVKLKRPDAVQEVGELSLNRKARWALWLDGAETGRDRIFFDLERKDGQWSIESLVLPPGASEPVPKAVIVDSLGIADAFLQATLRQDFERAKEFADSATVTDAKIAGLCILFEEGKYRLRPEKPLRSIYQQTATCGYLANVETTEGANAAEFSMVLAQTGKNDWRVSDLNLDKLLADYASRVAGGDVYFTPLVKNPRGGDTLVLYFGFDEDELSPRTARQLEIVGHILKTDAGKKLTLSGHTDALGTEQYNNGLSARRAATVKRYLVESGVSKDQIITLAEGQSQPRRPNFTESGGDNPDGRRANRRTEIYLDF